MFKSFPKVKRLDLSETSDVNIIPFIKRCPNVQTICLNDIYDDEENYGTDEEEDITDQSDESNSIDFSKSKLYVDRFFVIQDDHYNGK